MARKRYSDEEISVFLRKIELLTAQGMHASKAVRQVGVSDRAYYRWRRERSHIKIDVTPHCKDMDRDSGAGMAVL